MQIPVPTKLVDSLADIPSLDCNALLNSLDEAPSVCIRLNQRKTLPQSPYPDMEPVSWSSSSFYLSERPQFTLNPLLHGGTFYVQDASSTIYESVVSFIVNTYSDHDRQRGLRLLDLCAAPGGKTTAMINAIPDNSVVVANEFVKKRAAILRENLEKWGFPNIVVTSDDAARFADCGPLFDIVAVDAPCSGEGMMRKEEEARRQWSPELVEQCAGLQREILRHAAETIMPGGWLIYSTCTFNTTENERNARFIVDELGLIPIEYPGKGLPEECRSLSHGITDIPNLRFMPHITRGEGLFLAIFRRPADDEFIIPEIDSSPLPLSSRKKDRNKEKSKGKEKGGNSKQTRPTDQIQKEVLEWLPSTTADHYICRSHADTLRLLSHQTAGMEDRLSRHVNIVAAGVACAETKGRDLIPLTPLALSGIADPGRFPMVDLNMKDALNYLRRESVILPDNAPTGFVTISYNGIPLGYAKNLGNRANNLYPMQWRIKHL